MDSSLIFGMEFWESSSSKLLLNPRYDLLEKQQLRDAVNHWDQKDLVWLRSSGTESSRKGIKLVGLQKSAILAAARSVNQFYGLSKEDIWLNSLPNFHIGGLAIYARAFLSRSPVIGLDQWNPLDLAKNIKDNKVTVCSLVPTQIFDLVKNKINAPSSLRLVIVGGGPLGTKLYKSAFVLGWPIAISYGMTETSAMMAGTPRDQLKLGKRPEMELLPHINLHKVAGKWACQSDSLFDGYLWVNGKQAEYQLRPDPFILDDHLELQGRKLKVLGRESELVKILGETVNLNQLEEKISPFIANDFFIYPEPNDRRGFNLCLVVESQEGGLDLNTLNKELMPFEKLTKIKHITSFVRTSLGKVNKAQTIEKSKG